MNREETVTLLKALLSNAKESKTKHEHTSTVARRKYAGEPDLSSGDVPVSNWNFTKSTIQNSTARQIQGSPRPTIRARKAEFQEAAEFFQDKISAKLSAESISPLLRQCQQDTSLFGNGFFQVLYDNRLEYIYYFDVYIDNAKAISWDMFKGRYLFIRKLTDVEEFKDAYKKELRSAGVKLEDVSKCANRSPGRELVGTGISSDYDMIGNEFNTGYSINNAGVEHTESTNSEDGLVEYFVCWITSDESDTGWMQYVLYQDHILSSTPLKDHLDEPPILSFAADALSGQFWQPSDFVHIEKPQKVVNWITNRELRHVGLVNNPPVVEYADSNVTALSAGIPLGPTWDGSIREGQVLKCVGRAPHFMDIPSANMQNIKLREFIQQDAKDTELPDILQGQTHGSSDMSGKALRELSAEASVRSQLRTTNRDETLKKLGNIMMLNEYALVYEEANSKADMIIASAKDSIIALRDEISPEYVDEIITDEEISGAFPQEMQSLSPENLYMAFMPPELTNITIDDLKENIDFSWIITAPLERDQKVDAINIALTTTLALANGMPDLALKLAGKMTGQTDIADELIETIHEYNANQPQPAMQEQVQEQGQQQQQTYR